MNLQLFARSMKKRFFHTVINFAGASIGIACVLMITIYVKHELSFDQYQPYKERVYRMALAYTTGSGNDFQSAENFLALAPSLKNEFPEVEQAIRVVPYQGNVAIQKKSGNDLVFQGDHIYRADPEIFTLFQTQLIEGDVQALTIPNAIILSQSLAKKYFGGISPLHKALTIDNRTYAVRGVFEDIPKSSDLYYEALMAYDFAPIEDWGNPVGYTYALLKEGHDIHAFQEKLDTLVADKMSFLSQYDMKGNVHIYTQSLSTLHFAQPLSGDTPKGNRTYINILVILSIVISLIVAINFANFTASFYTERIHEVGVRKYLGAGKGALFSQFFLETVIKVSLVAVLSWVLLMACIPTIDLLANNGLDFYALYDPAILLIMVSFMFALCLLSLLYPAIYLLHIQASQGLKGRAKYNSTFFRRVLIGLQFFFTSVMVFFTLIVYYQMQFLENKNLGFNGRQVMVIDIPALSVGQGQISTLKSELEKQSTIDYVSVVGAKAYPGNRQADYQLGWMHHQAKRVEANFNVFDVDEHFIDVLQIKLIAGNDFRKTTGHDFIQAIVNEAFIKMAGFASAQQALGEVIYEFDTQAEIVGVVNNFHYEGVQQAIKPLVLHYSGTYSRANKLLVEANSNESIATIEEVMQQIIPETGLYYTFLDEQFAKLYEQEKTIGSMTNIFSIISIILACFGLHTLSSLILQQRTKEIGIRKILGAGIASVSLLLSKEFFGLALLSFVLAMPFAWHQSQVWLQEFAYRIPIEWFVFFFSALIIISVTMFGIVWNIAKGVTINPTECLKSD